MKKILILLIFFVVFGCTKKEPIDELEYYDKFVGVYNGMMVTTPSGKIYKLPYSSLTTKLTISRKKYDKLRFEVSEYNYSTLVRTFEIETFASVEKEGRLFLKDFDVKDVGVISYDVIWVKSKSNDMYHFYR